MSTPTEPQVLAASSRALAIPEVLGMTFNWSEQPALASSSCVSKFWSDVAMNCLWEELETVLPLLELLSPMKLESVEDRDGELLRAWTYSKHPSEFKWDRLLRYAPQVKKLTLSEVTSSQERHISIIAESAWTDILLTLPPGAVLLPNLKHLIFTAVNRCDLHTILPLVSQSLVELELSFAPTTPSEHVCQLLRSLTPRTANIRILKISTTSPASEIGHPLVEWIARTPKLVAVTLPRFYHTKEIICALARLPALEEVEIDYSLRQNDPGGDSYFEVSAGDFPKLRAFTLEMAPTRAAQLISTTPHLSVLNDVALSWQGPFEREELSLFIEAISNVCGEVRRLDLNIFSDNQDASFPLNLADVRPLLKCARIKAFSITHDFAFKLTVGDIEEMGRAWPELKVLQLCWDPDPSKVDVGSGTSMGVLPALAEHCPKLEEFTTFFNETDIPAFDGSLNAKIQFNNLRCLDCGTSRVPGGNPVEIGFFLGSLFRSIPAIETNGSFLNTRHPEAAVPADGTWKTVDAIVKKVVSGKAKLGQAEPGHSIMVKQTTTDSHV